MKGRVYIMDTIKTLGFRILPIFCYRNPFLYKCLNTGQYRKSEVDNNISTKVEGGGDA